MIFAISATIVLVTAQAGVAFAAGTCDQSSEQCRTIYDYYAQNNVLFYSAAATGGGTCSGSAPAAPATPGDGTTTSPGYSAAQVASFAGESVSSTWNIPDGTAEQWYLKSGNSPISYFGITSSNIGQITAAVKAAGVSPAFFYIYAVNENSHQNSMGGGFINHYKAGEGGLVEDQTIAAAVTDATVDAKYLVAQAQVTGAHPGTGGGEPDDLPTAEAQKLLDALPAGSIGKVYIPATSAVTAEIEDLYGLTGAWTGLYGAPLETAMKAIVAMGGDPMTGGTTVTPDSGGGSGCTGGTTACPSGTTVAGAPGKMGIAICWAVGIGNNPGYGYDQSLPTINGHKARESGWYAYQSNPGCTTACGDFDCSSFVASALTYAGYFQTDPFFATGTEATDLASAGFKQVATSASTSANLQAGDILIADNHHTEMYIGNNQDVRASQDENGDIDGGQVGDQTGDEIGVVPFYDDGWTEVWRASN